LPVTAALTTTAHQV